MSAVSSSFVFGGMESVSVRAAYMARISEKRSQQPAQQYSVLKRHVQSPRQYCQAVVMVPPKSTSSAVPPPLALSPPPSPPPPKPPLRSSSKHVVLSSRRPPLPPPPPSPHPILLRDGVSMLPSSSSFPPLQLITTSVEAEEQEEHLKKHNLFQDGRVQRVYNHLSKNIPDGSGSIGQAVLIHFRDWTKNLNLAQSKRFFRKIFERYSENLPLYFVPAPHQVTPSQHINHMLADWNVYLPSSTKNSAFYTLMDFKGVNLQIIGFKTDRGRRWVYAYSLLEFIFFLEMAFDAIIKSHLQPLEFCVSLKILKYFKDPSFHTSLFVQLHEIMRDNYDILFGKHLSAELKCNNESMIQFAHDHDFIPLDAVAAFYVQHCKLKKYLSPCHSNKDVALFFERMFSHFLNERKNVSHGFGNIHFATSIFENVDVNRFSDDKFWRDLVADDNDDYEQCGVGVVEESGGGGGSDGDGVYVNLGDNSKNMRIKSMTCDDDEGKQENEMKGRAMCKMC